MEECQFMRPFRFRDQVFILLTVTAVVGATLVVAQMSRLPIMIQARTMMTGVVNLEFSAARMSQLATMIRPQLMTMALVKCLMRAVSAVAMA